MKNIPSNSQKEAKQHVFSGLLDESIPRVGVEDQLKKTTKLTEANTALSMLEVQEKVRRMASKPGLRSKIDAYCMWCSYDPLNVGSWRQQVENCNIFTCPLHTVRPISKSGK